MKRDDAFMDAHTNAIHGFIRPNTTDPEAMRLEHEALVEAGVLDPDQPTPYTHYLYQQALGAEFTPLERMQLRVLHDLAELSASGGEGQHG